MRKIILASASSRRKEILKNAGIVFEVEESGYEEDKAPQLLPAELAKYLALKKAQNIARKYPDALVIGADTVVYCNGNIFGKPKTKQEAREILKILSGKFHSVITGVAIIDTKTSKKEIFSVETKVYFKPLRNADIEAYIETEEWKDKAGGYAIQESGKDLLVEKIEGDFLNVAGFPIDEVLKVLKKFDTHVLIN